MDRLEAMSVIVAVNETGSLSAASRRLRSPVATVSRKVAELETRLKAQLFQRSSRRLTLTDAGRSYIEACKRIIEQVDDAEREVSGEYRIPKGDLAVTAPWGLGHMHLLPIAVEFLNAYPEINFAAGVDRPRRQHGRGKYRRLDPDRSSAGQQHDCDPRRFGAARAVREPRPISRRADCPTDPGDLGNHDCITVDGCGDAAQLEICQRRA